MKLSFPLRLAVSILKVSQRDKKARRHNLLSTILVIGLSLIPLIVVLVVSNGMIEGITRRFIETGTYHMKLIPPSELDDTTLEPLAKKIESIQGVKLAFPEKQSLGLIFSIHGGTWTQIRSIPADLYDRDEGLRSYLRVLAGSFDLANREHIILGKAIAEKLGLSVGDRVKLLTATRVRNIYAPRITNFKVAGIISSGYQDLDKLWVYIPRTIGNVILPKSTSEEFIGIKVADPFGNLSTLTNSIYAILPPEWTFTTINSWYELEENQYKSFQTTKALLVVIMALIALIAIVNVSSTMVMIVMEKIQEIGILKSIGSSPGMISQAFLITGFITGLLGMVLGMVSGLVIAVNINEVLKEIESILNTIVLFINYITRPFVQGDLIGSVKLLDPAYYLEKIPVRLNWIELALIGFATVFLATLASFIPASRAGRIRPLEVMRRA